MPKITEHTGADFAATIGRLKEIAAQSGDALLTEGPVNPDHQLLDLCADVLHALVHAEKAYSARNWDRGQTDASRDAWRARNEELMAEFDFRITSAKPSMGRIRKMKATTAAGIYAKAAIVRASKTGAADLAKSLAEDLIACPGLRASLWPAGDTPTRKGGR